MVHIAQQLGFDASELENYNWSVGRIKDHRQEIREWLGFRPSRRTGNKAATRGRLINGR
ncbi:MAG: DUF4158 domain-containing protein [Chloroflexi bacterium]|nr:DUF4158 domain-containing protein [Chloroflexota bacterium]